MFGLGLRSLGFRVKGLGMSRVWGCRDECSVMGSRRRVKGSGCLG